MGIEMGSVARIAPADFLESLAPRGTAPPPAAPPLPDVGLVFEVNPESGDLVVKVVDRRGGRILRQIPPEEVQRFHSALRAMHGLLVDRKS